MTEIHVYTMSTGVYEEAGKCLPVSYAMVDTPQGKAFFAESCGRIVHLSLTDDIDTGLAEFKRRWYLSKPTLREDHCQRMVNKIYNCEDPFSCARVLLMGTEFQISVWEALTHIEEGTVSTYKDIAEHINCPDSVRAVANAIGDNPIAYLVPCHRVVRTDGSLGGYRWGLESKRQFLTLEGIDLSQIKAA